MSQKTRTLAALCVVGGAVVLAGVLAARAGRQEEDPRTPLPTGQTISPAGKQTGVGSFPVNMLLSPDGKWIAVTTTGYREYLSILDAHDGHLVAQLPFNARRTDAPKLKESLYYGLAFAPSEGATNTLYVSRGGEDRISVFTVDGDGQLTDTGHPLGDPSPLPKAAGPNFVAGLALNAAGTRCYAVNNETSDWTKQKGSVTILDTRANQVLGRVATGGFPLAVAAVTRGADADKKVYVSCERDSCVSVLDVSDPASARLVRNIHTGLNPTALLLDHAQGRCFVANAGSDTVSVIDTAKDRVVRTLPMKPDTLPDLPGVTPTGLALAPDESRLYVSLGDLNAVAVIDLTNGDYAWKGFLPAGWYPTSIVVSLDRAHLFVANAKGVRRRNPNSTKVGPDGAWGQYIENLIEGTVSTVATPGDGEIQGLTDRVVIAVGTPAAESSLPADIQHVIYIIKENRTYDQVLGDLAQGNGDPDLVLFGRDVTPNQHALAERFVLLDNFYDCAEVSADGWNWSTSGMANAYTERNVPVNYGDRGRDYDFEGEVNGTPVDLLGMPDVAEAPGGYLWDLCARKHLSYRNYGFFNAFNGGKKQNGKVVVEDNAPVKKALVGHTDVDFLRFALDYADSDAWKTLNCPAPLQRKAYGKFGASSRFAEWKREFDADVQNGEMPRLMMVRFPRDHTQGTTPGINTPRSMVADNDCAVGQLVEAVSHSPFWKQTAIFVLEDDAQNGHDHVDAHRSTCFVISPYVKRGSIDHAFYNTDSVLRSIEVVLGLPPMCRYDANAPLFTDFTPSPDNAEPYVALLPQRSIVGEVNQATAYRARDSQRLDFSQEDRVPDAVLNDIIWHSVKGPRANPAPVSRRQDD